mmetsp:Transcript_21826/g.35132  ORF Transcript_21826/g.35132 Transcript_21826/m.35132 type:complete len:221 (+) Transcript_21826:78-740(+)
MMVRATRSNVNMFRQVRFQCLAPNRARGYFMQRWGLGKIVWVMMTRHADHIMWMLMMTRNHDLFRFNGFVVIVVIIIPMLVIFNNTQIIPVDRYFLSYCLCKLNSFAHSSTLCQTLLLFCLCRCRLLRHRNRGSCGFSFLLLFFVAETNSSRRLAVVYVPAVYITHSTTATITVIIIIAIVIIISIIIIIVVIIVFFFFGTRDRSNFSRQQPSVSISSSR